MSVASRGIFTLAPHRPSSACGGLAGSILLVGTVNGKGAIMSKAAAGSEGAERAEPFVVEEPGHHDWGGEGGVEEGEDGACAWSAEEEEQGRRRFEAYYRAQRIAADEDLGDLFASMAQEAPVTFRVNTPCQMLDGLLQEIAGHEAVGNIVALEAFQGLAWSVSKQAGPKVRSFLAEQQNRGALCRQELVSLLPALVLLEGEQRGDGVADKEKSGDALILDMCARLINRSMHNSGYLFHQDTPL